MKVIKDICMPLNKQYFLTDEPKINLQEDDAFGHIYYSRALFEILEKSQNKSPYAIGLYGKWGVGKTSIINGLQHIINKSNASRKNKSTHNYKSVILDTWEYTEENFRREFLLDLSAKFDYSDYIKNRLTTKRIIESKEAPQFDKKRVKSIFTQLFLFAAIWAIVSYGFNYILSFITDQEVISEYLPILTGLIFALLSTVQDNIKQIFSFHTSIQETDKAVHPDEFRDLFSDIIKDKLVLDGENDRLLIILDNLDRVKEDVVIQILGAIKTFLQVPKCIYLLPCDDKGLKQHIISKRSGVSQSEIMSEKDASEYLRKFFQTTLTVRDLLAEDIESFTDDILDKMIIFDLPIDISDDDLDLNVVSNKNKNDVALVFRVAIAKNPRRIIHFANKLSANYLLANEKGKDDPNLLNSILLNLGFLAKISIIEENWPGFYSIIVENPDILRQLRTYFITENDDQLPILFKDNINNANSIISKEWNESLKDFLGRTNIIHSDFVSDFVRFKKRTSISNIFDYYTFHDAALTKDTATVINSLKHPETDIKTAFKELIYEARKRHRDTDTAAVLSISTCIIYSLNKIEKIDDKFKEFLANETSELLSKNIYSGSILDVGISDLLHVLTFSTRKESSNKIIERIIQQIDFDPISGETEHILNKICEYSNVVSIPNREIIRIKLDALSDYSDPILTYLRDLSVRIIEKDKDFILSILPQKFYRKNISLLDSADQVSKTALDYLAIFFRYLDEDNITLFIGKIENHLVPPADPATLNPANKFSLRCLETIPPEVLSKIDLSKIIQLLDSTNQRVTDNNVKNRITIAYLHILPYLNKEEQQPYFQKLKSSIKTCNATQLSTIIKIISANQIDILNLEDLLNTIKNKARSMHTNAEIRLLFFNLANDSDNPAFINSFIAEAWLLPDFQPESLEDAKKLLPAEEFRKLIMALMEDSDNLPTERLNDAFQIISQHIDRFDIPFLKSLTEELMNDWLMNKTNLDARRAAIQLWRAIREKAKREVKKFYNRLLDYSEQSIKDNTINKDINLIYINTLVEDSDFLDKSQKDKVVDFCLLLIEQGKKPVFKNIGYGLLKRLKHVKEAIQKVPQELIADLSQITNEEELISNLETLLEYKDSFSKEIHTKLLDTFDKLSPEFNIQGFKESFSIEKTK